MPFVGFAFGGLWAAAVALRFNLTTAWYVRSIQVAAASERSEWPFWTNKRLLLAFVYSPETLTAESDSPALREAKIRLLEHRATLPRRLKAAIGGAIVAIVAGLAAAIAVALLR